MCMNIKIKNKKKAKVSMNESVKNKDTNKQKYTVHSENQCNNFTHSNPASSSLNRHHNTGCFFRRDTKEDNSMQLFSKISFGECVEVAGRKNCDSLAMQLELPVQQIWSLVAQ